MSGTANIPFTGIFIVVNSNTMKLVRKITFRRVKEFPQFETISNKFNEMKKACRNGIAKVDSLSDLNYYIVVEYSNVVDRISYERIFPKNGIVDYDALIAEQKKLCEHIIRRNCGYPKIFKLLGPVNEVTGCYLIATRKSNVETLTIKNNPNTISIKLALDFITKEIEFLCTSYRDNVIKPIDYERADFEKFIKISFEEQDAVLQSVLMNVQLYPVIVSEGILTHQVVDKQQNHTEMEHANTPIRIEDIASKNVSNITSVEFLNVLLQSSLSKENYELCAKIRDRILELESTSSKK